jgi:tetratricopeptide (TPR) repeat protein
LEVNKKRLAVGVSVAVAVGLLASAIIYHQSRKETRASSALSEVRAPLNAGTAPPTGTAEAYLKVADTHKGTKAAARALLMSAGVRFQAGEYAEAQALFERFTREYPTSPWLAQAMFGVASCLDVQQKTTEALAKYDELRKRFSNDPVAEDAKLGMARLLEAQNKPAEAYKLYEELAKLAGVSGVGAEADMRMDFLLEKHPELAPPPPAPTTSPLAAITNRFQGTNRTITITNLLQPKAADPANAPGPQPPGASPLLSTPPATAAPPPATPAPQQPPPSTPPTEPPKP